MSKINFKTKHAKKHSIIVFSILRPSTSHDAISDHSDYEYYYAESMGKDGAPCERVFSECKASLLDQFSGVYMPMMNLMEKSK